MGLIGRTTIKKRVLLLVLILLVITDFPGGTARQQVITLHPKIPLWQEHGSDPTVEGSHLIACVFCGNLWGKCYRTELPGGLIQNAVASLQFIASESVLEIPQTQMILEHSSDTLPSLIR